MKKLFLIISILFVGIACIAQENPAVTKKLKEKYSLVTYHDSGKGKGYYTISIEGKCGACDKDGNETIPPVWDNVFFKDTYYEVEKEGKVGIRGLQNEEIIPCGQYDDIYYWELDKYGYFEVRVDKKVGVMSKELKEVIPCVYDEIAFYSLKDQPFCEITNNSKKGVYNVELGKEIVPCKYDYFRDFEFNEQTYYIVEAKDKKGLFDGNGREILSCIYDEIDKPFSDFDKQDSCQVFIRGNKYGLINYQKGNVVVDCIYGYLDTFPYDGFAIVAKDVITNGKRRYLGLEFEKGGKCGVIDMKSGKEIIPCIYECIRKSHGNLFTYNIGGIGLAYYNYELMVKGGKWGVIANNGKILIPAEYDSPIFFDEDGVAQVTKDGVTSILQNPLTGTSLNVANSGASIKVDTNITQTGRTDENIFAFIFANENYAALSGADFSINDGKVFAEYCRSTLGVPENNLRYYEDATYGNFMKAFSQIEDIADVYEGDAKFIFYFSGLGMTDEKTKERFLLPADASVAALSSTGISMKDVAELFNRVQSQYALVLVDAPFNGKDKTGQMLASARGVQISAKTIVPAGRTIIATATDEQGNLLASKRWGHGLFTYTLLEKLQVDKGNCTIKSMLDYAKSEVKKQSLKQAGEVQAPKVSVAAQFENQYSTLKF